VGVHEARCSASAWRAVSLTLTLPASIPCNLYVTLCCRAEPYRGSFPELGPPVVESEGVGHRFRAALEAADNIMAGYHNSPEAGGHVACLVWRPAHTGIITSCPVLPCPCPALPCCRVGRRAIQPGHITC